MFGTNCLGLCPFVGNRKLLKTFSKGNSVCLEGSNSSYPQCLRPAGMGGSWWQVGSWGSVLFSGGKWWQPRSWVLVEELSASWLHSIHSWGRPRGLDHRLFHWFRRSARQEQTVSEGKGGRRYGLELRVNWSQEFWWKDVASFWVGQPWRVWAEWHDWTYVVTEALREWTEGESRGRGRETPQDAIEFELDHGDLNHYGGSGGRGRQVLDIVWRYIWLRDQLLAGESRLGDNKSRSSVWARYIWNTQQTSKWRY